jgi:hypothetical protein
MSQTNFVNIIAALEGAFNRHAVDEIMAMFTDDAVLELKGLARLVGKNEIRPIFEYDIGVNGSAQFIDCAVVNDTVSCQFVEANDRLRAAGIEHLVYAPCTISLRNSLICSWWAVPDQASTQRFDQFWGPARDWIKKNHPNDYQRIYTLEGRFIRSRENGARVVELARQYRSMLWP